MRADVVADQWLSKKSEDQSGLRSGKAVETVEMWKTLHSTPFHSEFPTFPQFPQLDGGGQKLGHSVGVSGATNEVAKWKSEASLRPGSAMLD